MEINFEKNKYEFINLIKPIKRDGSDINALLYKLENSDFFVAPYSAKSHLSVKGGLCQHALDVYKNFCELVEKYYGSVDEKLSETEKVVGLLSNIASMNKFEQTAQSKKVYSKDGKLFDELGNFNWVTKWGYQIKDDRFFYGHYGQNSEYIINTYIPLTFEESVCITNLKGGISDEYQPYDLSSIYNKHPLAALLHMADFLATYIDEREEKSE